MARRKKKQSKSPKVAGSKRSKSKSSAVAEVNSGASQADDGQPVTDADAVDSDVDVDRLGAEARTAEGDDVSSVRESRASEPSADDIAEERPAERLHSALPEQGSTRAADEESLDDATPVEQGLEITTDEALLDAETDQGVVTSDFDAEVDEASPEPSLRVVDADEAEEEPDEDPETQLKGLLEALLFVSDRPLSLNELARAARLDRKRTAQLLAALQDETCRRGIRIDDVAGGYAFRSHPRHAPEMRRFLAHRPIRLSRAQLETLAIVAYRQPITRPEVDEIRGVDCGAVLKGLLERDFIRILGKKDEPGRPMLYGTTPGFLSLFSLDSLKDLPTLKEFTELSGESKTYFEEKVGEPASDVDAFAGGETVGLVGEQAEDDMTVAETDAEPARTSRC